MDCLSSLEILKKKISGLVHSIKKGTKEDIFENVSRLRLLPGATTEETFGTIEELF
jgi:hypothetical protein